MKRTSLRARPKSCDNDPGLSHAWWVKVVKGKECVVPGCKVRWPLHGHHVLSQQVVRREFPLGHPDGRGLQDLLWDERNGVAVCGWHHLQHEAGMQRIPASAIPLAAFKFAADLGLAHRLGPTIYPR